MSVVRVFGTRRGTGQLVRVIAIGMEASRGIHHHLMDWRRRLERGDVTTIADLAREEGISDRYVSPVIRLAWLAPSVLERLVLRREPTVLSIFDLCGVAELPWSEQPGRVFD